MQRFSISENAELVETMKQRDAIVKRADEIRALFTPLEEEMKSLMADMDKLKEKTVPIVKEIEPSLELNEFELVTNLYLVGDTVKLEILDQVEEHKEFLRNNKNELGVK
jgi:predicted nuclease with TOPRIM domain